MKNVTAIMIILSFALASCTGNNAEPAETGATTAVTTTATTTVGDGTSTSRCETTVAETVTTAAEETEEPFDVDEFLADCTVYDVTVETITDPLDELMGMSDADKPEKVALRFTDIDGLLFFLGYGLTEYNVHIYYVTHISSGSVEIAIPDQQFGYAYVGFDAQHKNGTTVIENSNGHGTYGQYYVIRGSEYYLIENSAAESGVALYLDVADDGEVTYKKIAAKYHVHNFEAFLTAYESDDDFYQETGSVTFENGEVIFVPNETKTIGDGHIWSDAVNSFFEKYGVDSVGELAELYKQYVAEGKQREFMGLDE